MTTQVTIVTDGTAAMLALAKWLKKQSPVTIVEARNALDVEQVLVARDGAMRERVATIASGRSGTIDLSDAHAVVQKWLAKLPPIEARAFGSTEIQARIDENAPGTEAVMALLAAVSPVRIARATGRRGRPPGSNPFEGVGFDVCIALLLDPAKKWTQRSLGDALLRAPSAVDKTLTELARRGHLLRNRSGTSVRDALLLRDDLVAAWRGRIGVARDLKAFRTKSVDAAWKIFKRAAAPCALAGPSAITGPAALTGGPTTLYTNEVGLEALSKAELPETPLATADLVVWPALERGVFHAPREGPQPMTNRVVTYLDLVVSGSARQREAAEAVWQGAA